MTIQVFRKSARDQEVAPVGLREGYRINKISQITFAQFQRGEANTLQTFRGSLLVTE